MPHRSESRATQSDARVGSRQVASGALHRPVRNGRPVRVGGALLADESGDSLAKARQIGVDAARHAAASAAAPDSPASRASVISNH